LHFQWNISKNLIKSWTAQASEDFKIINVPWLIQSQEASAAGDYSLLQQSMKDEILLKGKTTVILTDSRCDIMSKFYAT